MGYLALLLRLTLNQLKPLSFRAYPHMFYDFTCPFEQLSIDVATLLSNDAGPDLCGFLRQLVALHHKHQRVE